MTSKACGFEMFDLVQDVKNYIDSVCRCDDAMCEEVAKSVFFCVLKQNRNHREFCDTLKDIYLDEKDHISNITDIEELRF